MVLVFACEQIAILNFQRKEELNFLPRNKQLANFANSSNNKDIKIF